MKCQFVQFIAAGTLLAYLAIAADDASRVDGGEKAALLVYRKAFKEKRTQQMAAATQLLKVHQNDYAKAYKMVEVLMGNLFKMLQESKVKVIESGYIPGGDFPKDQQQLDALSSVLENTAFFGDILLRLPDITHKIYKKSKEWELLAKWSISFCSETKVYDEMDTMLLNLVAQELEFVPKDPNYINPFKLQEQMMQQAQEKANAEKQTSRKKKKEKKKRGPRLSGHTEL